MKRLVVRVAVVGVVVAGAAVTGGVAEAAAGDFGVYSSPGGSHAWGQVLWRGPTGSASKVYAHVKLKDNKADGHPAAVQFAAGSSSPYLVNLGGNGSVLEDWPNLVDRNVSYVRVRACLVRGDKKTLYACGAWKRVNRH
ncbi:hypothetical protein [Actinomadura atramentaria]|uniref:hypothetical protein n=1 Tax=Actinomadura atramentaria TaxID=1990 RepID=UPI00036DFD92|nr:hypothetical protein [Actinomadura atramentaria]